MTLIITVELFVTMARLAQGQTSVIMVKIGARRVKIRPAGENSSHGKNSLPWRKITVFMLSTSNITY